MVRYLFYTIGDLTYQSPLVAVCYCVVLTGNDNVFRRKTLRPSSGESCM